MLTIKDIENTYWNHNGKHEQFVNDFLYDDKIDKLKIKKGLKDKFKLLTHRYYRFYNDGDIPRFKAFKECRTRKEISETLENEYNKIIEEIKQLIKK